MTCGWYVLSSFTLSFALCCTFPQFRCFDFWQHKKSKYKRIENMELTFMFPCVSVACPSQISGPRRQRYVAYQSLQAGCCGVSKFERRWVWGLTSLFVSCQMAGTRYLGYCECPSFVGCGLQSRKVYGQIYMVLCQKFKLRGCELSCLQAAPCTLGLHGSLS